MLKKIIVSLLLLIPPFLPTHLLATEQWQPNQDLVKILRKLSNENIERDFPKLVSKDEREQYAVLMAQIIIYKSDDMAKGDVYLKLAQEEQLKSGKLDGSISTNLLAMVIAGKKYDNDGAIEYGNKALAIMQSTASTSDKQFALVIAGLGHAYSSIGDFENELKVAKELITLIQGTDDTELNAEAYFNIAEANYRLGNYNEAEKAGRKSYLLYLKTGNNKGLGHTRKVLGNVYLGKGNLTKALENYEAAVNHYEMLNNNHGLANCYFNIGLVLTRLNHWKKAIETFELASFNYIESGSSGGAGISKMEIGRSFIQLKEFKNAQLIFKEARSLLTNTNKLDRLKQLTSYENELNIKMVQQTDDESAKLTQVEQSPIFTYQPNELSEWLSSSELKKYVAYLKKQGLWSKKIWLTELNGKLIDDINHYRIRYSNVPQKHSFGWYWYYGITKNRFTEINKEKSNKGFDLIHHNIFSNSKGEKVHQGIWHKVNNLNSG